MRDNDDSDLKGADRREPPSFAPPSILDRLLNTLEPPSSLEFPPRTKTAAPDPQNVPPKTKIPPAIAARRGAAPDASKPVPPMGPPKTLPDFHVAPPARKQSTLIMGLILVILLSIVLAAFIILMFWERAARQQTSTPQPPVTVLDEAAPDEDDPIVEPAEPPPRIVEQPAAANVLHIRKLVLCRSVSGFGHYERIPNTPLRPNHFPHIQAYVEIAHPKPEQRDDGRYVYRMTKTLKVYRSDIGPTEPVMDTALSLVMGGYSPRSDFHSAQPLQPSRRIQPGEYILVVSITDQISGETTTEDISFLIHGP